MWVRPNSFAVLSDGTWLTAAAAPDGNVVLCVDGAPIACSPSLLRGPAALLTLRKSRVTDDILIISPEAVVVAHLPPRGAALATAAKLVRLGNGSPQGAQAAPILDAQWHPLSHTHVVVLYNDALRIFDTSRGSEYAAEARDEWLFPADALPSPPSVFSFGEPRGWELTAVFIGCVDGSIWTILPVLPSGCLLPVADWEELGSLARLPGRAARPSRGGRPATTLTLLEEAGGVHCDWLRSCFVRVPGEPDWVRYEPAGAGERSLHGPRSRHGGLSPALQGPIELYPALDAAAGPHGGCEYGPSPLASLAVLPATACEFPSLVLATGDGRIVSIVGTEPLLPAWGRPLQSVYDGAASVGHDGRQHCCSWGRVRCVPLGVPFASDAEKQHQRQTPASPDAVPNHSMIRRRLAGTASDSSDDGPAHLVYGGWGGGGGSPAAGGHQRLTAATAAADLESHAAVAEIAAAPWLVVETLTLGRIWHPRAVADAAVRAGGAALPGGAPPRSLLRMSSSGSSAYDGDQTVHYQGQVQSDTAAAAAYGDAVCVPFLIPSHAHPTVFFLCSRHALHAVKLNWVPAVRRALSSVPAAGGTGAAAASFASPSGAAITRDAAAARQAPPSSSDSAPESASAFTPAAAVVRELLHAPVGSVDVLGVALVTENASSGATPAQGGSRGAAAAGPLKQQQRSLFKDTAAIGACPDVLVWMVPANTAAVLGPSPSAAAAASSLLHGGYTLPGRVEGFVVPAPLLMALGDGEAESSSSSSRGSRSVTSDAVEDSLHLAPPFGEMAEEYRGLLAECSSSNKAGLASRFMRASEDPLNNLIGGSEALLDTIAALRVLQGKLTARAALVQRAATGLERSTSALAADVATVSEHAASASNRLELLSAGAANLRSRAHAIVFALALKRGRLSRAEAAYCDEVDALHAETKGRAAAMLDRLRASVDTLIGDRVHASDYAEPPLPPRALADAYADADAVVEATSRSERLLEDLRYTVQQLKAAPMLRLRAS